MEETLAALVLLLKATQVATVTTQLTTQVTAVAVEVPEALEKMPTQMALTTAEMVEQVHLSILHGLQLPELA